jgi:sRNA-binding regulator protein Hfq
MAQMMDQFEVRLESPEEEAMVFMQAIKSMIKFESHRHLISEHVV